MERVKKRLITGEIACAVRIRENEETNPDSSGYFSSLGDRYRKSGWFLGEMRIGPGGGGRGEEDKKEEKEKFYGELGETEERR